MSRRWRRALTVALLAPLAVSAAERETDRSVDRALGTSRAAPATLQPVSPAASSLPGSAAESRRNADRSPAEVRQAMMSGDYERAAALLKPLVEAHPNYIGLANDYAYALAKLNRDDEARRVLEKALGSNESSAEAFANLREILSKQAATAYSKAMGRKPPAAQLALRRTGEGPPPPPAPETLAGAGTGPVEAGLVPAIVAGAGTSMPEPSQARMGLISEATEAKLLEVLTGATRDWAEAWSGKNFDAYVGFYASTFEPQNHASFDEWRESRRPRILKAEKILVQVSDFRVRPVSDKEVEVRFRQRYESGALKVNSLKTLTWIQEASGWKIRREEGR